MKIVKRSLALVGIVSAVLFVGGGHAQHLTGALVAAQPKSDPRSILFYDPASTDVAQTSTAQPTPPPGPCGCPFCCAAPQNP